MKFSKNIVSFLLSVVIWSLILHFISANVIPFDTDCPFPDDLGDCKCYYLKGLICEGPSAKVPPIILKEDYPVQKFDSINITGTMFTGLNFMFDGGRWIKTDRLILQDNLN